jgi:glycosyltransferase 2 family protein
MENYWLRGLAKMNFSNNLKICASLMAISIASYLIYGFSQGSQNITQLLDHLSLTGFIAIILLTFLNIVIRFARWHFFINQLGNSVSLTGNFGIYLSGFSLTASPGKSGEMLRAVYLLEFGVPVKHTLAAFLSERFCDLISLLLIGIFSLSLLNNPFPVILLLAALCVLIGFLYSPLIGIILELIGSSRAPLKIKNFSIHIKSLHNAVRVLLKPSIFLASIALGVLAWSLLALGFVVIAKSFGLQIQAQILSGVFVFSLIAGALSLIPGGIGATELSMTALLTTLGVPAQTSFLIAAISRLSTIWLVTIIGIISLGVITQFKVNNKSYPTFPVSSVNENDQH